MANSPIVILVLLATGACIPFQLLMNECIAATESRGQARSGRLQIGVLLSVQALTCAVTIYVFSVQRFPTLQVAIMVVLLAINTGLSYRVSLRYYRLVTQGVVSIGSAAVVGTIPGFTSLLLYLGYSFSANRFPQTAFSFMVASTVLPSLVQWGYLKTFAERGPSSLPMSDKPLATLVNIWLFAAVLALAALAAVSTHLRETIAHLSSNQVALILVALNSILSLINTLTRAAFLNRAGGGQQRLLAGAAMTMAIAGVVAPAAGCPATPAIALIATQLSIAWVIEAARRMPTSLASRP